MFGGEAHGAPHVHNGQTPDSANSEEANAFFRWVKQQRIPYVEVTEDLIPFSDKDGYTDAIVDPLACAGTDPVITVLSGQKIRNTERWKYKDWIDENNHSLVIRIDYGAASFMIMGDLELPAQEYLFAHYRGTRMLNVDVYQVSHHGSHTGTNDATVNALTPKYAIMGAGPRNIRGEWTASAYGHPHCRAVKALLTGMGEPRPPIVQWIGERPNIFTARRIDKAIYSTGWDGDIVITVDKDANYDIKTSANRTLPARQASRETMDEACRNSSGGSERPQPPRRNRRSR